MPRLTPPWTRRKANPNSPCASIAQRRLRSPLPARGAISWHDFAVAIFEAAARYGINAPEVRAIQTAEYPTPARRPANSELSTAKFERAFGMTLRPWKEALTEVIAELTPVASGATRG